MKNRRLRKTAATDHWRVVARVRDGNAYASRASVRRNRAAEDVDSPGGKRLVAALDRRERRRRRNLASPIPRLERPEPAPVVTVVDPDCDAVTTMIVDGHRVEVWCSKPPGPHGDKHRWRRPDELPEGHVADRSCCPRDGAAAFP